MNRQSAESLEKKRLNEIATEYRKKGYRVVLYPGKSDIPAFIADHAPDMIVYGPKENVIVEVKSKTTLSQANYLASLTSKINAQPGWRLELVVTNPSRPSVVEESAEALREPDIRRVIEEVNRLLNLRMVKAALMVVWSATEASLRLLAEVEGTTLEQDQPQFIVKKLYSLGILSQADYDLFQEGMRIRNLVAHGFQATELKPRLVRNLRQRVDRILKQIRTTQDAT